MALDLPPELDVLSLKKPSPGNVPKERLSCPVKACAIVHALMYANRDRSQLDSQVKGMLDGNAPYAYEELKKQGQSNRTNVNFREGEALMGDAITPFYDLFAESDTYARVVVDEKDADKQAEYSRIVTEEFDLLMKEWAGFDWNMQAILFDMVGYGKGFAMWPDKTSWQFKAIRQSRVLVPDQTSSDIDQLELLVVRQNMLVHELYNFVRDAENARSIGWDTTAVLEACERAMPVQKTDDTPIDWELVQQELRNHDLYQTTRSSVVRSANIYVKEFDGRVSHLIVEERDGTGVVSPVVGGTKVTDSVSGVFLYKKIGRFDSFREALNPMFYDIGDGTWHSIKGLAIKLYPFIGIKNRLNCSIVDNAFINMSVLLKPTNGKVAEATAIMQLGPLSILPPNMEAVQWGLAGRMEEGLAIESSLTRKLESNLGQYRKPLMKEQGNPVTATQVMSDSAKEASLGKGAVNRFYAQLDMLFEGMFKRASNPNLSDDNRGQNAMALEFQRRCVERGVPKVKLQKPRFVRATRNLGNGSIFLRQQTVFQTAQFVPMMNEAGKDAWLNDAIAVTAGTEAVNRWNPKQGMSNSMKDEQAYAVLENSALKDGSPVQWTSTQNNAVHASTHLKAAVDALNAVQKGANPMQVVSFLDNAGPHIATHLEQLRRNPTQAALFKQLSEQFAQLAKITDQLKRQMQQAQAQAQQQQQQQAQRQQQVMNDAQLNQMELQAKIAQSNQKTQAGLQQKAAKTQQSMQIADAQSASQIARMNVETLAKIEAQKQQNSD